MNTKNPSPKGAKGLPPRYHPFYEEPLQPVTGALLCDIDNGINPARSTDSSTGRLQTDVQQHPLPVFQHPRLSEKE